MLAKMSSCHPLLHQDLCVGEDVTQEDIKGEYKHGILKLFVPKKEAKPVSNDPKYITIE